MLHSQSGLAMRYSLCCAFAIMMPIPVFGELDLRVIQPGEGYFPAGASFTEVLPTDDGHRITFHLEPEPGSESAPEGFQAGVLIKWNSDVWSQLTLAELSSIEPRPAFAPFGNENGFPFHAGDVVYLPPRDPELGDYGLHFFVMCGGRCPPLLHEVVEYSVIEIAPPLPGDFNVDSVVNFSDFLILSANFGERRYQIGRVFKSWMDGDANLDDRIDFDDFLILSHNFGTTREPQLTVVPEPVSLGLIGFVLCSVGMLRPRRSSSEHGRPVTSGVTVRSSNPSVRRFGRHGLGLAEGNRSPMNSRRGPFQLVWCTNS